MHFFHADELLVAGEPEFDDDERIEVATFALPAAWRLVADGTADAKTALALFWLQGGAKKIGSGVVLAVAVATDVAEIWSWRLRWWKYLGDIDAVLKTNTMLERKAATVANNRCSRLKTKAS